MEEIWKDIDGLNGYYKVSNLGRVKSLERMVRSSFGRTRLVRERILKFGKDKDGYLFVIPRIENETFPLKAHRLVAKYFLDNPENKPQVNHKNGIKTDNRYNNLEWCTPKENADHSWKIGLSLHKGENHFNSSLCVETVKRIREIKSKGEMTQVDMAKMFNVSTATISRVVNFDLWKDV